MLWSDTLDIAIALCDAHPDTDPQYVRFTDLHRWICELPDFNDNPENQTSEFWKRFKWHGWKKRRINQRVAEEESCLTM